MKCECGKIFSDWWVRPIRCSCGRVFDDGKNPAPHKPSLHHPQAGHIHVNKINKWHKLHSYAAQAKQWSATAAEKFIRNWNLDVYGSCSGCGQRWAKLDWKFNFSSPESFFRSTWEAHNYVSDKHAHKPVITLQEAEGLFRAPWVTRKSRLVVTCCQENHQAVLQLTEPLMRDYATRCDADFLVIDDDLWPHWSMANKWRAARLAWHYDQTLYVDSDVIIKPSAPDIFQEVSLDASCFAARDERPDYSWRPEWFVPELQRLYASQSWEYIEPARFPNGGVMLMTAGSSWLYRPYEKPFQPSWCAEQFQLTRELDRHDSVVWLDDRWNWGFIRRNWWQGLCDAWFIHLNGARPLEHRLQIIERLLAGNYQPISTPAYDGWVPNHEVSAC